MHLDDVGEIIAARKLYLLNDEKPTREVFVLIGKPQQFRDSFDYYCPFQIEGIGSEAVRFAAGVDAIQAIELVMKAIGAELYVLRQKYQARLEWQAGEEGDLGFPMPT
jgi:hypothetical protein